MAMPLLQALARGESLTDTATLGTVVGDWLDWSRNAQDVGNQTRAVLPACSGVTTEESALRSAQAVHDATGRSAGNGSLMRTGPIALGYLDDGQEPPSSRPPARVAQLTHWESSNADACAIWCLAIRHAIRTGELEVRDQVRWIPEPRREHWTGPDRRGPRARSTPPRLRGEERLGRQGLPGRALPRSPAAPRSSTRSTAPSAAATTPTPWPRSPARWPAPSTAPPPSARRGSGMLHGWPGLRANDLTTLAVLATRAGVPDSAGWPTAATVPLPGFEHTAPRRHPHDSGVWLGSQSALADLPPEIDAVVSLSRVGSAEVPAGVESVRVWLVDKAGHNAHLDFVLTEAADAIAALRAENRTVFVHCAEARSRTAAVAALYAARHRGVPIAQAWDDVEGALPLFKPADYIREAVDRLADPAVVPRSHDARER